MVDAGMGIFGRETTLAGTSAPATARPTMTVDEYAAFAAARPCAPAQSPAWINAWTACNDGEYAFATVEAASTRLALPLEIVRTGACRVARFLSDRHANGNFPPFEGGKGAQAGGVREQIKAALPGVDLVHLERLAPEQDGIANPLLALAAQESPNIALAVSLDGGFEELLDRASGKRKRKKHRSQTRKFEAAGGHRRVEASTDAEVDALLDGFFAMKAERFLRMGIADVFADAGVQAAFRAIFKHGVADPDRSFVLHGLEVAGRLRAVTGSSRCGGRLICEFGAIAEDDVSFASPGEYLFYDNIHEACEQGFTIYDFSVGDERYKRLWCNIEVRHFDVLVPLTAKGAVLAAALKTRSRLKRFVKRNEFLWSAVKRLRRGNAPAAAQEDAD